MLMSLIYGNLCLTRVAVNNNTYFERLYGKMSRRSAGGGGDIEQEALLPGPSHCVDGTQGEEVMVPVEQNGSLIAPTRPHPSFHAPTTEPCSRLM